MAQKMTGALVFDERTDRYDIRFDLNSYYGGLHCGECFDVFFRGFLYRISSRPALSQVSWIVASTSSSFSALRSCADS